ncbi:RagB/SusD family nutrient uptake outer membrane protein [Ancylomarina sp. YFZ004]
MKNILKSFIALSLLVNLSACSDEFLEQTPSDRPSEEVLFNSIGGAQVHLNGIYALQNASSAEGTVAFVAADMLGEDATLISSNNYGRFKDFYRYNFTVTNGRAYDIFRYNYRTIANCNLFLTQIDGIEGDAANKNDLKSQALALRAFSYFNLVRWYGETAFTKDPAGRGVPINTTVNGLGGYDIPRSTVGEVYTQIVTDLATAEANAIESDYKGFIDAKGIAALQARVCLTMGDWTNASKYAKKAYAGFTLMNEEAYLSGFNSTSTEVIWEQRFVDSDVNTFMSIPSFTYTCGDITYTDTKGLAVADADDKFGDGVVDYKDLNPKTRGDVFVYGYNSLRVTRGLINLFSDSDIRKKMFPRSITPEGDVILNEDGDIAYAQFHTTDGYLTTKFNSANPSALGTGDFPRIRATEMYLIEAEAEANLGNTAVAQTALLTVQERADASVVSVTETGAALLDKIYLERRKELFFEGHRFFDLKRLDLDLDRTASTVDHWSDFTSINEPTSDVIRKNSVSKKFCMPIPQKEIDANEALTDADQNEAYK